LQAPATNIDLLSQPGSRNAAGLFAVRRKPKDSGERTAQLDPQLAVLRHEAGPVDQ
jgi:hypothetical protein